MKVIDLGQRRDVMQSWAEVQELLRRGGAMGFALMLMDAQGQETIYLGGHYKDNGAAAKAGLKLSLEVVKKGAADEAAARDRLDSDRPGHRGSQSSPLTASGRRSSPTPAGS